MSRLDRIRAEREFLLEEYENPASFQFYLRGLAKGCNNEREVLTAIAASLYNRLTMELEPEYVAELVEDAIAAVWREAKGHPFINITSQGVVKGVSGRGKNETLPPAVNGRARPSWTTLCQDAARQYAHDAAIEDAERDPRGSA